MVETGSGEDIGTCPLCGFRIELSASTEQHVSPEHSQAHALATHLLYAHRFETCPCGGGLRINTTWTKVNCVAWHFINLKEPLAEHLRFWALGGSGKSPENPTSDPSNLFGLLINSRLGVYKSP